MQQRRRFRGERGIAIVTTGLLLIPMMIFAAFGVDLASWYSRISYLQKSADAAALAGTVWMPNEIKATQVACESLARNGITGGDCGTGPFEVDVLGVGTSTLRVTVTDPDVQRYFSQVMGGGNQSLTRSAEAEYNLPIPLGSPLNYFGGDSTRTDTGPGTTTYSVAWPTDYTTRSPSNAGCNVGPPEAGAGRWHPTSGYQSGQQYTSGTENRLCTWLPLTQTVSSPPSNATVLAPTNVPCNRQQTPTSQLGRWNTGTPPTYTNNRFASGTGNRQCTWLVVTPSSLPANYNTSNPPPTSIRGCNIPAIGRWPASGAFQANQFTNSGAENRLCAWTASISSVFTPPPPNPINPARSPGFWAAIEGPQVRAFQGDAYSTRCYTSTSCTSDQNAMYLPLSDPDRGFWYTVRIPAGLTGSVALNVFDASYTPGNTEAVAGDRSLDGGGAFTTTFRVYRQNNPLDFGLRTPIGSSTANTTDGSCHWNVGGDSTFFAQWRNLCNLTVSPGQTYLINVQTPGTTGAGVNGYALEAVAGGSHSFSPQPALHAYSSMGMQNNNFCAGTGCTPPPATFYLAEVGPQYAGRTLVMELWDSGDVSTGSTAAMYPRMPATTSTNPSNPNLPRPVIPVPAANCSYTASADPNSRITGTTGTEYLSPQSSDYGSECGIQTSTGSGARFNGEWLRIRIDIPANYTCTLGRNPETQGGSCWWGIRYTFSSSANDVTTWQARIEGNPVQLTA